MNENETKVKITEDDVRRSGFIFRAEYKMGTVVAQIIAFLFSAVASAIWFVNYLSPMKNSILHTTDYTTEQRMKTIFLLMGILFFILGIMVLIKVFPIRKTFLCVNEKGVYGCAGRYAYFATQSFVIPKDQISRIYAKGNSVYIESGGNNYRCAVCSPRETADIVNAVLTKGSKGLDEFKRNNNGVSYSQAGRPSYLWTCPKCSYTNSSTDAKCTICGEPKSN